MRKQLQITADADSSLTTLAVSLRVPKCRLAAALIEHAKRMTKADREKVLVPILSKLDPLLKP